MKESIMIKKRIIVLFFGSKPIPQEYGLDKAKDLWAYTKFFLATAHVLEDFVGIRREKFYYCPYFDFG